MEAKERKERFITLLNELLNQYGGTKVQLAQKLNIKPPTLTRWFQGKIDPASLELTNFLRLSEIANLSPDELAVSIGMLPDQSEAVLDRFQILVQDLLESQSLEQLGKKLGVTHGAISGWLSSKRKVNPQKIYIGTITAIALEKGWTLERLLIYLGLKETQIKEDLFLKLKSNATALTLVDRVKLLAWLSDLVQKEIAQDKVIDRDNKKENSHKVCIIFSREDDVTGEESDLSLAQKALSYLKNIDIYTSIELKNIEIAIISKVPEPFKDFDLLIFDLENISTSIVELISRISFNGDIVIFTSQDLKEKIRDRLKDKITDIVLKPIDWDSLKDKPYFTST